MNNTCALTAKLNSRMMPEKCRLLGVFESRHVPVIKCVAT